MNCSFPQSCCFCLHLLRCDWSRVRETIYALRLIHITTVTPIGLTGAMKSGAAYLERDKLLSGISRIQCFPCPNHSCQFLVVVKFLVCSLLVLCLLSPSLSTKPQVQLQDRPSGCHQVSMNATNRAPRWFLIHKLSAGKTSPRLVLLFLSPSLILTSLWLVAELQQSMSGWGLAGIKQLNAWADYFRDSLPPVPTNNYLSLGEGWAE